MHLKLQAAATDWDAELAVLDGSGDGPATVEAAGPGEAPADPGQADPEAETFRARHAQLHEAVFAVLEASEGEIRYLV
jgi:hypothetical protein